MAKKKANANKTPAAPATAAAETEVIADAGPDTPPDPVADAAGDPPDPDAEPVELSEPVIETGDAGGTDKKAADKTRRETAIAEHQDAIAKAPVNEELQKADEVKDDIRDRMDEIAAEVAVHDEAINVLRDESSELLLELYPQQGENDPPSIAIRGYINASARERQHRKLAPIRLKAILEKAGLAPIDAAFSRARGRGMARPIRKAAKKAAPAAADQAKDATPTKKAE